jgi:hypothetical protein
MGQEVEGDGQRRRSQEREENLIFVQENDSWLEKPGGRWRLSESVCSLLSGGWQGDLGPNT